MFQLIVSITLKHELPFEKLIID